MLQKVTERMAFFLWKKEILSKNDIEWCAYLFQKRILNIGTFIILYVIGCCFRSPVQVFLYLSNLWLLRRGGGYHAKTPLRCFILSISVEVLAFKIIDLINRWGVLFTLITGLSFIILWFIYPKDSEMNKREIEKSKEYLRIVIILELIMELIYVLISKSYFYRLDNLKYWNMGVIVTAVSLLIVKYKRRGLYAQKVYNSADI